MFDIMIIDHCYTDYRFKVLVNISVCVCVCTYSTWESSISRIDRESFFLIKYLSRISAASVSSYIRTCILTNSCHCSCPSHSSTISSSSSINKHLPKLPFINGLDSHSQSLNSYLNYSTVKKNPAPLYILTTYPRVHITIM